MTYNQYFISYLLMLESVSVMAKFKVNLSRAQDSRLSENLLEDMPDRILEFELVGCIK